MPSPLPLRLADSVERIPFSKGIEAKIARLARREIALLLEGPTGVGKTDLAKHIHEESERSDYPFVYVNCGNLRPGFLSSDLFGHKRGAFTGASADRGGLLERADKGTLFLDEVDTLNSDAQVAMLRVMDDGTFRSVGADDYKRTNVRLIAATGKELAREVTAGRFRKDLFSRLGQFSLRLPALKDDPERLRSVIAHYVKRYTKSEGVHFADKEGLQKLLSRHPWEGNLRELRAVFEYVCIMFDKQVTVEHFAEALENSMSTRLNAVSTPVKIEAPIGNIKWEDLNALLESTSTLDGARRQLQGHITSVTVQKLKSASAAAKKLGVSRGTIVNYQRGFDETISVSWLTQECIEIGLQQFGGIKGLISNLMSQVRSVAEQKKRQQV